jgi:hypothetical protein
MKISDEEFRRELGRMVESPAWPELSGWFTEHLVRLVISSQSPGQVSEEMAHLRKGATAFLLAIENEVTRSTQESIHANRTRVNRAAGKTEGQRPSSSDGRGKRARGPGKQTGSAQTG